MYVNIVAGILGKGEH